MIILVYLICAVNCIIKVIFIWPPSLGEFLPASVVGWRSSKTWRLTREEKRKEKTRETCLLYHYVISEKKKNISQSCNMKEPWMVSFKNDRPAVCRNGCFIGPCRILLLMLATPSSLICGGGFPHFVAAKVNLLKRNSRCLLPKCHRSVKVILRVEFVAMCG